MGGARSSGFPGPIARYLSGLCAAGLVLCAAGWLVLAPFAFGYRGHGSHDAALTDLATGGGLALVCLITLAAWGVAWRRALYADGVLTRAPRGEARASRGGARAPRGGVRARRRRGRGAGEPGAGADPAQVLTALRALLAPLLEPVAEPLSAETLPAEPPFAETPSASPSAAVVPGPRSAPEEAQAGPAGPERIAVIESMLAGAELLMTGCEEEEAW
jgi:hypothetical protein